jgi:hypothetical protein
MNLAKLYAEQICPACGFKLDFTPWAGGEVREKFCPCCGIHFGYDDAKDSTREAVYLVWRKRWIVEGRRWWAKGEPSPDYNPAWQLERLEHLEKS